MKKKKNPSGGSNLAIIHSQEMKTENGVYSRPHSVSNFNIYIGWLCLCLIVGYFISWCLNVKDYRLKAWFPGLISFNNYISWKTKCCHSYPVLIALLEMRRNSEKEVVQEYQVYIRCTAHWIFLFREQIHFFVKKKKEKLEEAMVASDYSRNSCFLKKRNICTCFFLKVSNSIFQFLPEFPYN